MGNGVKLDTHPRAGYTFQGVHTADPEGIVRRNDFGLYLLNWGDFHDVRLSGQVKSQGNIFSMRERQEREAETKKQEGEKTEGRTEQLRGPIPVARVVMLGD